MTKDLTERLMLYAREYDPVDDDAREKLCSLLTEAASLIQRLEGERDEAISDRNAKGAELWERSAQLIRDGSRFGGDAGDREFGCGMQEVLRAMGVTKP